MSAPLRGWAISCPGGVDLDDAALIIGESTEDNDEDVDNLPDQKTTAGAELNDAGDDLAGVDAVNAANAKANQQAEQECEETGTTGAEIAARAVIHDDWDWLMSSWARGVSASRVLAKHSSCTSASRVLRMLPMAGPGLSPMAIKSRPARVKSLTE